MRVLLKFHGIVGDLMRPKLDALELPEGATLGDALDDLAGRSATAAGILKQTHAFVDGVQAKRDAALTDGATITIMRPIGGGSLPIVAPDAIP